MKYLFLLNFLFLSSPCQAYHQEIGASLVAQEMVEINDSTIYFEYGVYQYIVTKEETLIIFI